MNMSQSLNFSVIAEGVETEKQRKTLEQCGIHYMQGYYFSPPMENHEAWDYLNNAFSGTQH